MDGDIVLAGITHYDMEGETKVLPAGRNIKHAVPVGRWRRRPYEPDFRAPYDYAVAWCGRTVKVVLGDDFDSSHDDTCRACAKAIAEGERAPSQFRDDGNEDRPRKSREIVFVGFERYDETVVRSRVGEYEIERSLKRTTPAEPGFAHAVSVFQRYPNHTRYLDHDQAVRTWCGTWCLILTEYGFYDDDKDACPICVEALKKGVRAGWPLSA